MHATQKAKFMHSRKSDQELGCLLRIPDFVRRVCISWKDSFCDYLFWDNGSLLHEFLHCVEVKVFCFNP